MCIHTVRQAYTKQDDTNSFQMENKVHDNEVPDMLKKMANKEMAGASQEDKRFCQILEKSTKLVDGHCKITLSFRRVDVQLPNNKLQAEKRLASLKKKNGKE